MDIHCVSGTVLGPSCILDRKEKILKKMEVENFGLLPVEARQRTQRWGGVGGVK